MATALRFPAPPREVPRTSSLAGCAPKFAAKVEQLIARMRALGFDAVVYETLRTNARQTYLFGFGRDYDDGRGRVTNSSTAEHTWHFYGLAVDIISAAHGWDAPLAFWDALEREAEALGLTSGRDWDGDDRTKERMIDGPHVQWKCPGMRRSPSPVAAQLKRDGGNLAVWRELHAA